MFLFIRVLIKIISGIIFIIQRTTHLSDISENVSRKYTFFEIQGLGFTLAFKIFRRVNGDKHEV